MTDVADAGSLGKMEAMDKQKVVAASTPRTLGYYRAEVLIVLGVSLGQSAVYAVVNLLEKMTRAPLASQTTTLNPVLNQREVFDFVYQLLGICFALVPVALVLLLMTSPGQSAFRSIGFTFSRPRVDFGLGFLLALVMGAGTLAVYAAGRALGITTAIVPAALDEYWWTVPVLVLSALRHAILEEVVMVGYLFNRFAKFGWGIWTTIFVSAALRGTYHLYQGIGPGIGNFLMGLVFGYVYTKVKRVMPLVVAHALLDIAGFVGYALVGPAIGIGT